MRENSPESSRLESEFSEINSIVKSYRSFSNEITRITGEGETTSCESAAERRAGLKKRKLIYELLENFPNKQDLPEFILLKVHDKERKYFFLRANKIYSVSFYGNSPDAEKDPRFLPENSAFFGEATVSHLIKQNEKTDRPLSGIHVEDATPRFSSEGEVLKSNDVGLYEIDYGLSEKLRDEDLALILEGLERSIRDPENKVLFGVFQSKLAEIDKIKEEEQKLAEERSAERIKDYFLSLVRSIEAKFGSLPDRTSLYSEEDIAMEESMAELGNAFRKSIGKKSRPSFRESSQMYFYPNTGKLEVITLRKTKLGRRWREDESTRREATAKEMLDQRWKVKYRLFDFIPEKVRQDLDIY